MRLPTLAALVAALAMPICASSAEISAAPNGIHIDGQIVKGDARKLALLLTDSIEHDDHYRLFLFGVRLNSPGGDVEEAMKIARLVEQAFTSTSVSGGGSCASACFLIWAAGVERHIDSHDRLGVHRLSLAATSVDIRRAERAIAPATQSIEAFLLAAGIPRLVIQKMNETPSSDIFWVTPGWLIQEGIGIAIGERPAFLDVAEKACGINPYYSALRAHKELDLAEGKRWTFCGRRVRKENQQMHRDEVSVQPRHLEN